MAQENNKKIRKRWRWTRQQTINLIAMLELNPLIWRPHHPDYSNMQKREKVYLDMATEFNKKSFRVSVEDIRCKLHTIRSQYKRLVKKLTNESKDTGVAQRPRLWLFEYLSFLWPVCAPNIKMPIFVNTFENTGELMAEILYEKENTLLTSEPAVQQLIDDESVEIKTAKMGYACWQRKYVFKLIRLYKEHELLWNPRHVLYEDNQMRETAISEITKRLKPYIQDINEKSVKNKIYSMRSKYVRYLRSLQLQSKLNLKPCSSLWFFKYLKFLRPLYSEGLQLSTINNVESSNDGLLYPEPMSLTNTNQHNDSGSNETLSDEFDSISKFSDESLLQEYKTTETDGVLEKTDEIVISISPSYFQQQELRQKNSDAETDDKNKIIYISSSSPEYEDYETVQLSSDSENDVALSQIETINVDTGIFNDDNVKAGNPSVRQISKPLCELNLLDNQCMNSMVIDPEEEVDEVYNQNKTKWLGQRIVNIINNFENEDIVTQTVTKIKTVLQDFRQKHLAMPNAVDTSASKRRCCNNKSQPCLWNNNSFEVSIDTNMFQLREITVKVKQRQIIIQAISYLTSPPKLFERQYMLPNGFDIETVTATRTKDGQVKVRAKKSLQQSLEYIVPIQQTSKSQLFYCE